MNCIGVTRWNMLCLFLFVLLSEHCCCLFVLLSKYYLGGHCYCSLPRWCRRHLMWRSNQIWPTQNCGTRLLSTSEGSEGALNTYGNKQFLVVIKQKAWLSTARWQSRIRFRENSDEIKHRTYCSYKPPTKEQGLGPGVGQRRSNLFGKPFVFFIATGPDVVGHMLVVSLHAMFSESRGPRS